jgi:hypothetical protein
MASVAWVERKRNPGLTDNPKPDLQNQQGRGSFQQGDVKRWLVPNRHFHERQRQRVQAFSPRMVAGGSARGSGNAIEARDRSE